MKKPLLFILTAFLCNLGLQAQPEGYYSPANGKTEAQLKTAMHEVIRKKLSLDYDGFSAQYWGDVYYKKTDWNPGGYYWDMYSNEQRTTYSSSAMSREHCMPRSWWGSSSNYGSANSDIHNLYPADYTANSKKSNNPLGEVGIETWNNGAVWLGKNAYPEGYAGTVFEPADEYKGDFARTYFYMVTSYEDYADRWKDDGIASMLNAGETYPVFQDWAIDMLLEWSRMDPVSQKEIDRNQNAYELQLNRNPFVDFPDLAEYIWGNKKGEVFTEATETTSPIIYAPTNNFELEYVTTSTFGKTRYLPINGKNLTKSLTLELSGTDAARFSIAEATILPNQADTIFSLGVTFKPTTEGVFNAVLTISSDEISPVTVNLKGTYAKPVNVDPIEPTPDMDVMIFYSSSNVGETWNPASLPSNFTTNVTAAPYANGDMKMDATGKYLIISIDEDPEFMMFALKPNGVWGENENHIRVYESINTTSWGEPIADFTNADLVANTYFNTPQIELTQNTRAIKIQYTKVGQNVGLNNLIITRFPFSGIGEENIEDAIRMYVRDGNLYVSNVNVATPIYIYDMMGKSVYRGTAYDSENTIPLTVKGVMIVRIGDKAYKIINK